MADLDLELRLCLFSFNLDSRDSDILVTHNIANHRHEHYSDNAYLARKDNVGNANRSRTL